MSSEEDPESGMECHGKNLSSSGNKVKAKRVRQRVDAGEPRNSYASIPNFSSRPPSQQQHSPGSLASLSPYSNGYATCKMLQSIYDEKTLHPLMMLDGMDRNGSSLNGTGLQNPQNRLYLNGGSPVCDLTTLYGGGHNRTLGGMITSPESPPTPERSSSNGSGTSSNSHLLRDILQQGRKYGGSNGGAVSPPAHVSAGPHSSKCSSVTSAGHGREELPRPNGGNLVERVKKEKEEEEEEVITEGESEGAGPEERRDNAGSSSEIDPVQNQKSPQPSQVDGSRVNSMMRMMSDLSPQQPPPPPASMCSSPVSAAALSPSGDGNISTSIAVPNQSSVVDTAVSPASSPALSCCSPRSAAATPNWQPSNIMTNQLSQMNSNCSAPNDLEVKRARVETIVNNMLQGPAKSSGSGSCTGDQPNAVNGCKKRKLYQPQQHETCHSKPPPNTTNMNGDLDESLDDEEEDEDECLREPSPKRRGTDLLVFREQLRQMQDQLVAMQQQYIEMIDNDSADEDDANMPRPVISPVSDGHGNARLRPLNLNIGHDQRSPDNSDYEEQKPRVLDIVKEHKSSMDNGRSKSMYLDYDNTSLYDDQKKLIIDHDNTNKLSVVTRPSHHEQNASSDDGLKSGLKDICRQSCIVQPPGCFSGSYMDYSWLAESLKAELSTSLGQIVDEVMSRCAQRKAPSKPIESGHNSTTPCSDPEPVKDQSLLTQMLDRKSPRTKVIDRGARLNGQGIGAGLRVSPYPQDITSSILKPSFFFPFKPPTSIANAALLYGSPPQMPLSLPLTQSSYMNSSPVHHTSASTPLSTSLDAPEQTEPVSLVVTPKKKRHKVTDTRLNPRGPLQLGGSLRSNGLHSQDSQDISPKYSGMLSSLSAEGLTASHHLYSHPPPPPPLVPVSLPTSVAIPNPSLNQSDFFHGFPYEHHSRLSQYSMDTQDEDVRGSSGGGLLRNSTPTNSIHHPLLPSHGTSSGVMSHHPQRGSPDSLHYSHLKQDSGDMSDTGDSPGTYDTGMPMISFLPMMHTSTLTPMHLRKAKLMFFYARYPSSAVLKMYFPDIKFNKNNTAQLVKWFSNFREFFYIQMEKYARQAMSEGIKVADDLKVTPDSELLRVLNLHYNRNNHIEAPENFRYVVEQTLREFFKALMAGKDSEQSWKKSIYKIIARLDDNVPEYFKSPNFLETLE